MKRIDIINAFCSTEPEKRENGEPVKHEITVSPPLRFSVSVIICIIFSLCFIATQADQEYNALLAASSSSLKFGWEMAIRAVALSFNVFPFKQAMPYSVTT